MHKNSSAPSNHTALWHYLGTNHLDFRRENNSTPGVLIEEEMICRLAVTFANTITKPPQKLHIN